MLNKIYYFQKTTMSLPEFLALERGELTLKDIKNNRRKAVMYSATKEKRNSTKKLLTFLTTLGITFQVFTFNAYGTIDVSQIDYTGSTNLIFLKTVGYWTCIIIASKDILISLLNKNTKKIGKNILKSLPVYGGLYILPWCLETIKEFLI